MVSSFKAKVLGEEYNFTMVKNRPSAIFYSIIILAKLASNHTLISD